MHFSDHPLPLIDRWPGVASLRRALAALLLLTGLGLVALPAQAHKSSDAYLRLVQDGQGSALRVDIALRDLDAAIDLDANGDARLSWGEIKAAWPAIDAYVKRHVRLSDCRFPASQPALERRADGVYAVVAATAACQPPAEASLQYTLLGDIDPTHRGLASVQRSDQPAVLKVLDPRAADTVSPAAVGSPPARPVPDLTPAAASTPGLGDRLQFVREGVHHILTGYDHVLFLLCLLLPAVMRRTPQGWQPVGQLREAVWPVIGIVTAFTLAHSITLALAALKLVSLPGWFIEPAIAVTIMLAALDNLKPIFGGRRALVTFFFGLIHGFGFAGVLAEMQLPAATFAWALLQFNVGLELGQIAIVLLVIGGLFLARQRSFYAPWVIRGGSCAAMVIGLLWLVERTADVSILPL